MAPICRFLISHKEGAGKQCQEKKDKFTQIYFNEADPMTEIDTYNADLKRRLRSFAAWVAS